MGGGSGATPAQTTEAPAAQEFAAGTTMKRIQDKGEIVIGVKYIAKPQTQFTIRREAYQRIAAGFGEIKTKYGAEALALFYHGSGGPLLRSMLVAYGVVVALVTAVSGTWARRSSGTAATACGRRRSRTRDVHQPRDDARADGRAQHPHRSSPALPLRR